MCSTCGCGDDSGVRVDGVRVVDAAKAGATSETGHGHGHGHPDGHSHPESPTGTRLVTLEQRILAKNDDLAGQNRAWLAAHGVAAVNLMSSPGSGKTTLLERTLRDADPEADGGRPIAVIEGDQETELDAARIRATGAPVVQVNTGAGCHLDADMLRRALDRLEPADGSLVFVENVGNLVCPSLFDLGEAAKVVVISVTEGQDKPLKYPHMFAVADLVLINKIDLLPYVDFDVDVCAGHARSVNPDVEVLPVSATAGTGLSAWYAWLHDR